MSNATARRERGMSPHPGILVIRPTASRPYYALRYADPVTGTSRQPRLPGVGSAEEAQAAALQLVESLRALRGTQPNPTPELPAPAPVRARQEARTRGVVIIRPRAGRQFYALRYTDPSTGKCKQPRLAGVTTLEAAEAAAETLSRTLQRRRLDVTLAGGREYAGTTCSLAEEVKTFLTLVKLKVSKQGAPTSPVTLRRYRDSLKVFTDWCETRDVAQLGQLARTTLDEWLTSRRIAPAHGNARAASTVNQEVKPVRQMLVAAAIVGRISHMSSDAIRGALPRLTEPAPAPRCYSVVEMRAVLQAALDYDDQPPAVRHNAPPLSPIMAVALLTGMRRGELAKLQCRDVLFDAPSAYDPSITTGLDFIRLPAAKTKTHQKRDIEMAPYSPLLGELMRALIRKRAGHERVLRVGYSALGDYAWRLRDFGAPEDFALKHLRSTCATYQSPLPGNAKAKAGRLGHTLAIAELHYLALPSGTPVTAPDLETVMKCSELLRVVIERARR
jgi:integrase